RAMRNMPVKQVHAGDGKGKCRLAAVLVRILMWLQPGGNSLTCGLPAFKLLCTLGTPEKP
ncbi:MAG: hypothetical protein MR874_05090, partial [Coriobacteriaceae bacterium]|nr:hypothetical protein [Coriobacteriaceae bacterium]